MSADNKGTYKNLKNHMAVDRGGGGKMKQNTKTGPDKPLAGKTGKRKTGLTPSKYEKLFK